jgi:hypothetical protein
MAKARVSGATKMSRALFSPNLRLAWSAASITLLAAFVAGDWAARARGWGSYLAPTAGDLWVAVGLGGLVGLTGCVWERFLLTSHRADQLAFHRAPLEERLRWRHQWRNLRQNGWFMLLMFGLIGWCTWSWVFVLQSLLAVNAVMFACNRQLVTGFRAEREDAQPHSRPTDMNKNEDPGTG